jgi:hypothetical protein
MTPKPLRIGAELDFDFVWRGERPGPWLATGETVTAYTVQVSGAAVKLSDSEAAGTVKVWLKPAAGAQALERWAVVCAITTSAGRKDVRQMDGVIVPATP